MCSMVELFPWFCGMRSLARSLARSLLRLLLLLLLMLLLRAMRVCVCRPCGKLKNS